VEGTAKEATPVSSDPAVRQEVVAMEAKAAVKARLMTALFLCRCLAFGLLAAQTPCQAGVAMEEVVEEEVLQLRAALPCHATRCHGVPYEGVAEQTPQADVQHLRGSRGTTAAGNFAGARPFS